MVKIIATSIAYFLGHKTGQYVIPHLKKFIETNKYINNIPPLIMRKITI